MKISIITAVHNNERCITDCLKSVRSQTYKDIEHIVIDGGSTDGTLDILNTYKDKIDTLISEPDRGVYYALNSGIKIAKGEVIGFLHSDDVYASENSIKNIMDAFADHDVESVYGDLDYVSQDNTDKVVRHWKSGPFDRNRLKCGWMPPHPAFFVKKSTYEKYGYFNTDYGIAADYDIIMKLLYKHEISAHYIDNVIVRMRLGGISNKDIWHLVRKWQEDYAIHRAYGLGWSTLLLKNLSKIPQFFIKNRARR